MTRVCTVCTHEKRYEIEEHLATRQGTYRGIARKYDLSEDAVSRHVKGGHIGELITLAADAERAARADSLLDRMEALQAETKAMLDEVKETDHYGARLGAIREMRRNLELIGEITKELERAGTIKLDSNPEWEGMKAVIFATLEPHPQAKDEVFYALQEHRRHRQS